MEFGIRLDSRQPINDIVRIYQKAETILDLLAARKILVFPFAGFFGRDSNYPTNPADQSQYIKYTLARRK